MLSHILIAVVFSLFFFFNDTATTEIYTLSLHDALPISPSRILPLRPGASSNRPGCGASGDRKSTRLLQSPMYLVCRLLLEKKKKQEKTTKSKKKKKKNKKKKNKKKNKK